MLEDPIKNAIKFAHAPESSGKEYTLRISLIGDRVISGVMVAASDHFEYLLIFKGKPIFINPNHVITVSVDW